MGSQNLEHEMTFDNIPLEMVNSVIRSSVRRVEMQTFFLVMTDEEVDRIRIKSDHNGRRIVRTKKRFLGDARVNEENEWEITLEEMERILSIDEVQDSMNVTRYILQERTDTDPEITMDVFGDVYQNEEGGLVRIDGGNQHLLATDISPYAKMEIEGDESQIQSLTSESAIELINSLLEEKIDPSTKVRDISHMTVFDFFERIEAGLSGDSEFGDNVEE